MVSGIWGRKIGMTQLFKEDKAIPVTAIDVSGLLVTGLRTLDRDGYNAIQVGKVKKRFKDSAFSNDWSKCLPNYFEFVREVKLDTLPEGIAIGSAADFIFDWEEGSLVDVFGKTRGKGFAGVVKRYRFGGPPGSHGSKMGKKPGSSGFFRRQGRVIKGKRFPGHMGNVRRVMKNLDLVRLEKEPKVIFVKGSIPGHSGSLVFIRKVKQAGE